MTRADACRQRLRAAPFGDDRAASSPLRGVRVDAERFVRPEVVDGLTQVGRQRVGSGAARRRPEAESRTPRRRREGPACENGGDRERTMNIDDAALIEASRGPSPPPLDRLRAAAEYVVRRAWTAQSGRVRHRSAASVSMLSAWSSRRSSTV